MRRHHFTVDVEEHFQVSAFEGHVGREAWEQLESRVASSVARLLAMLAAHGARGTFFILGMVAERHPDVVGAIASAGHEVASHGWDHQRVTDQTPQDFRASVAQTKALLESLTGQPVLGFRAPSFSIVPGTEWALDILLEEGYRYDSSLFPVRRGAYGYPQGRQDPHWLQRAGGRLAEIPPATIRRFGVSLPAGGGAYFRLLPYRLTRTAFIEAERRGVPGTFYIHPWELDPDQPRFPVPWFTRLRHYSGLEGTAARLGRLLSEFQFTAIRDTLDGL